MVKQPKKSRRLTKQECHELNVKSVERIKPYLLRLERWRQESINPNIRL